MRNYKDEPHEIGTAACVQDIQSRHTWQWDTSEEVQHLCCASFSLRFSLAQQLLGRSPLVPWMGVLLTPSHDPIETLSRLWPFDTKLTTFHELRVFPHVFSFQWR